MEAADEETVTSSPAVSVPRMLVAPTDAIVMSVPASRVSVEVNVPPTVAMMLPSVAVTGSSSSMLPPETSVTSEPAFNAFVAVSVVAAFIAMSSAAVTVFVVTMLAWVEVSDTSSPAITAPLNDDAPRELVVTSPAVAVIVLVEERLEPVEVSDTFWPAVTGPLSVIAPMLVRPTFVPAVTA